MWRLIPTEEYESRYRRYRKKRPEQLDSVLNNLERFLNLLRSGRKLRPLVYGFLRDEGDGILRVSESGAPSNVAATRLYVYPDSDTETLYLLTIGDKNTQGDDINFCKWVVKQQIRVAHSPEGKADDGHDEKADDDQEQADQDG